MSVLKVIEILSSSKESWEDATSKAVAEASKTLMNIRSAYVQDQSVTIKNNKVDEYRLNLKITFSVK